MPRRCDIWRPGIVHAPIEKIVERGGVAGLEVSWLPEEPPFTFLADPFGLWRNGWLHVFVERYDYRTRHGVIECLLLNQDMQITYRRTVLREPWHLSYPYVFEAEGDVWMLPEAHRSGTLTLYRAKSFPDRWEPAAKLPLDVPAVDPTILHHDGRWWLFYCGSRNKTARLAELRLASAPSLMGPWTPHPGNPLRISREGARPGGTPSSAAGAIILPVQDSTRTYGGALRMLTLQNLDSPTPDMTLGLQLTRPVTPFGRCEGMHTLAPCGDVTLIDVKLIDRTGRGWLIDLARTVKRR